MGMEGAAVSARSRGTNAAARASTSDIRARTGKGLTAAASAPGRIRGPRARGSTRAIRLRGRARGSGRAKGACTGVQARVARRRGHRARGASGTRAAYLTSTRARRVPGPKAAPATKRRGTVGVRAVSVATGVCAVRSDARAATAGAWRGARTGQSVTRGEGSGTMHAARPSNPTGRLSKRRMLVYRFASALVVVLHWVHASQRQWRASAMQCGLDQSISLRAPGWHTHKVTPAETETRAVCR